MPFFEVFRGQWLWLALISRLSVKAGLLVCGLAGLSFVLICAAVS